MATHPQLPRSRWSDIAFSREIFDRGPAAEKVFFSRKSFIVWLTVVGYYGATKIGFWLTPLQVPIAAFWPPNAFLLAVLLLTPRRMWWIIVFVVLPTHLFVQLHAGVPLSRALGWYVGNVGEATAGALLVCRYAGGQTLFDNRRNTMIFVLFGAIIAPLLTSFFAAGVVVMTGGQGHYWILWAQRLFSNMLADLTVVPAIVMFASVEWRRIQMARLTRYAEASVLGAVTILVSILAFAQQEQSLSKLPVLTYAPLPLLLWATIRFGPGGLSLSLLTIALISMWNVVQGHGLLTVTEMEQNILSVQVLLCTAGAPLLFLSASIAERALAESRLRQASGELIHSQEQERRRIARELHDDIGHRLALIQIGLDELRDEVDDPQQPLLQQLHDQVGEANEAAREISHGLHPYLLEHRGLGPTIKSLCRETSREIKADVEVTIGALPRQLAPNIALCLYRVTQEALHNIAKHSDARKASIELKATDERIMLRIVDDGVGFSLGPRPTPSFGIASMKERIRSVGGTIEIRSAPRRGTSIEVIAPLKET